MPDTFDLRPTIALAELDTFPAAQTLVVTVNNRLARRVTLALAALARSERQVSELPQILPLSAWLAEASQGLTFEFTQPGARYRLDAFASQLLWSRVIGEEEADRVLLDVGQAARLAMEADTLMDEWALRVPAAAQTDEFASFLRWRTHYRRRLDAMQAEDANRGYEAVLDALTRGRLALPANVILAGFSEVSPRFARLLRAFQERGAAVLWLQEDVMPGCAPLMCSADDDAGQWHAAAAWAAARLRQNPEGRYAIVSPTLQAQTPYARRVLARTLAGRDGQNDFAFNVAVGRPLAQWPAVRAAIAWLRALALAESSGQTCGVAVVGAAMLAGHDAGDPSEMGRRAALDARWRRQARSSLSIDQWLAELARPTGTTVLARTWREARSQWSAADATCEIWAVRMRHALTALGYPGERSADSVGFQVISAFSELLDRYSALAPAAGTMNGDQALALLESLAQASAFQPQRDPGARLDVLGLLEAEGGRWDGVWILGLSDDVLPATPKPNPLISLAVLRQAQTPRATPERERAWAESMFAALCRCAPEVIASYGRHDGERERRPSPLIARCPAFAEDPDSAQGAAQSLASPCETLTDERGPPLDSGAVTRGGLDVLDTQARNPMWAFVRHRLGGRALPDYADVATINVRGQFLHKALELVWRMLRDQDALHASMRAGRLPELIAQSVAQAADAELRTYPPVLRELECERAQTVLYAWLDREAQRTPFTVDRLEASLTWQRASLSLKVRLDRGDRLPDGRSVIVDYKTGSAILRPESDWARARPINIQLPFYASILDGDNEAQSVAALVLAQIHARQITASGLCDSDLDLALDGVASVSDSAAFAGQTWADIKRQWRHGIEILADEFGAGYAANVAYRADDLTFCDARPFLRLDLDNDD